MSHILIDAATGAPVPLPYYTETLESGIPASIHDFDQQRGVRGYLNDGVCAVAAAGWYVPAIFGLAIITEEEFMRRQVVRARLEQQDTLEKAGLYYFGQEGASE